MRINSNILALTSARQLAQTTKAFQRSLERLASGSRVNSARDDAAGMAIGTGLESQRRGMLQAIRNMNDARGFLGTAEGALTAQTDLIQRMRELALQAANGTLSDKDRGYLNSELQQLVEEFNRISSQTEFNGVKLLDGSFETTDLQIGATKGQTISFNIAKSEINSEVLETQGSESFTAGTNGPNSSFPTGFTLRDLNGDGKIDLLQNVGANDAVYLGNGNGTFAFSQNLNSFQDTKIVVEDFNGFIYQGPKLVRELNEKLS